MHRLTRRTSHCTEHRYMAETQSTWKRPQCPLPAFRRTAEMTLGIATKIARAGGGMLALLLLCQASFAGPLRDRIIERRQQQTHSPMLDDGTDIADPISLPAGIRVVRDVAYGSDPQQRFDVYAPAEAKGAPVIFIVHGGGWFRGDKAMRAVVENKVARWVPKGFVVVSTNYRLLPKANPIEQARDVARALAVAQDKAASWGGDRSKFILIGHSAGAHLVSLLTAAPSVSSGIVSTPWLGTVSLDSAAFDVVKIMEARHFALYDPAFGRDP
jgi:arylformamidase